MEKFIIIGSSDKKIIKAVTHALKNTEYAVSEVIDNGDSIQKYINKAKSNLLIIDDDIQSTIPVCKILDNILSKHLISVLFITNIDNKCLIDRINNNPGIHYIFKPIKKESLLFGIENAFLNLNLQQRIKTYKTLFENIVEPVLIFAQDNHKILDCNQAFLDKYGYTKEELHKMTPFDLHPEHEHELVAEKINIVNKDKFFEYHHVSKLGRIFNVEIKSNEIVYNGKKAFISIIHDITQAKKTEQKIKKNAEQAKLIFEIGKRLSKRKDIDRLIKYTAEIIRKTFNYYGVAILLFDNDMEYIYLKGISGGYRKIFPPDMKIKKDTGIIGKAARTKKTVLCKNTDVDPDFFRINYEKTKSELVVPIISKNLSLGVIDIQSDELNAFSEEDARTIEIISSQVAISIENAKLYQSLQQKLTQVESAQKDLKKTHQELDKIFNTAIDGIMVIDKKLNIHKINNSLLEFLNINNDDALNKKCYSVLKSDLCNTLDCPIYKISKKITKYTNSNVTIHTKSGDKKCTISSSPFFINKDEFVGIVSSVHDLTEYNAMQTKLLQSQKLLSIGQLAAGIAHEINTPTQYVGDNVRFFKQSFEEILELLKKTDTLIAQIESGNPDPRLVNEIVELKQNIGIEFLATEIPSAIDQTLDGIERIAKIVLAMKEFAHPGVTEKTMTDINRAIETTTTIARNRWKYVSDLELDLDPDLPSILCYVDEFNQVILNLIVNAADAIEEKTGKNSPEKGLIKIKTENAGEFINIYIQDTGNGIPDSIKDKIFDPFFTTKEVGKGTGQGLAISYSVIVDKHNGKLSFISQQGKGTTFKIELPVNTD